MHAYLIQCAKRNRSGLPFHQIKTETLEGSATNDGRSMLLTVLYKVEGLETETLK